MSKPIVQVLKPNLFRLLADFSYEWSHEDYPRQRLTVKANYLFDGSSIPKALHSFIGTWDLSLQAPLFHDALYECAGNTVDPRAWFITHEFLVDDEWILSGHQWFRSESDRLFFRHMREADVPRWKRRSAYKAVRLFGSRAWRRTFERNPQII
jgi:hypothetical protein